MKLKVLVSIVVFAPAALGAGAASAPPSVRPLLGRCFPGRLELRREQSLDGGWRFRYAGDERRPDDAAGADWRPAEAAAGFDDSGWEPVSVPHTWNALDGEDGGDNYRRGAGWYRRHLVVDPRLEGRRLYLQFDGVSLMADVFVNGKRLGTHRGGFARFRIDATGALQPGKDNVIAVRADNGRLGIAPISADFTFFGGIYRDVALVATDPVQISAMDYGSPGVYVEQLRVGAGEADLNVRVKAENHETTPEDVSAWVKILDRDGRVVGGTGSGKGPDAVPRRVEAGGSAEIDVPVALRGPHLWNGRADPYLYQVAVALAAGAGRTGSLGRAGDWRDVVVVPLGLRCFRVDPDQGFFLNGRHLGLHGVNRHQDRIDKGWAISDADEAQDFSILRELGCTAIRVSHYQQSDSWYGRCDEAGIVAWAEIPFVNETPPSPADPRRPDPAFVANAEQQLRELIRQNFNHPSICFWSVGNETRDETKATGGAVSDAAVARLAEVAREEDPTRLSTYASHQSGDLPKNWRTSVVAFNRYEGWYGKGAVGDFAPEIDAIHASHPTRCIGLSEYGAGASIAQHQDHPSKPEAGGKWHPEEYQAAYHEAMWSQIRARPWLWGTFVWNLFDFASDRRDEGDHPGRNDKGLITYDRRVRKDAFYFYKANWSDEPVLYIASRRFADRTESATEIKVYSNAPQVEVRLNGVSLGAKSDPGLTRVFTWTGVELAPGPNRVEAAAVFSARSLCDACVWTLHAPAAGKP